MTASQDPPKKSMSDSAGAPGVRAGNDPIGLFARHPTAAHLLMALMIVAGLFGLDRMTTQYFPDFGFDIVSVTVVWPGAGAADVDANIAQAIEREVRFIDDVEAVRTYAFEGWASIAVEFEPGSDMQAALSNVEAAVSQAGTLPGDAERPTVRRVVRYDTVSRILLSGPLPEAALRAHARRIRDGLLQRGVKKVDIGGLNSEELLVEVQPETLRRLGLTLGEVASAIRVATGDTPSGGVSGLAEHQLRSLGADVSVREVGAVEIRSSAGGGRVMLRDVATVRASFGDDDIVYRRGEDRAIELHVLRMLTDDALALAETVEIWLDEIQPTMPPTLRLERFDVQAEQIRSRVDLLLYNGATGLAIVLFVLFLFLNVRVASWVAAGIPVSLAAAMMAMWLADLSVNMVSMFAIIMAIGIVVDDAIVVSEHAEALHRQGHAPALAAEAGARRMVTPVFCAALTTIAAFLPLLLITDVIGAIIRTVPLAVIAVIVASLVECFLVLPGHMRHALGATAHRNRPAGLLAPLFGIGLPWLWPLVPAVLVMRLLGSILVRLKGGFDSGFDRFRDRFFVALVRTAVRWRYTTVALAIGALIGAASLVAGGRVDFVFFVDPEADMLFATAEFSAGTPRARTRAMLAEIERAMHDAERHLTGEEGSLVRFHYSVLGKPVGPVGSESLVFGHHVGGLTVELVPADERTVSSDVFVAAWKQRIEAMPGLRMVKITSPTAGPPGRDIDVRLTGARTAKLKRAAEELKVMLGTIPGVVASEDNLAWGKAEKIIELTPRGRALGFTVESVGRELRHAFEGVIARRLARGEDEVAVRARLPEDRRTAATLHRLHLRAPDGGFVPLGAIATMRQNHGFARIKRENGAHEVAVTADLDTAVVTTSQAIAEMKKAGLEELARRHGVEYRFEGRDREQRRTFRDMALGAGISLVLIYIVLAWAFADYMRPLVVMSVVPLSIIGAVLGHWAMGYDLTILSLIALVGLSGIVVNNSIILVSRVSERIAAGEPLFDAIAHGARDRLRAILLTSATTVGGLTPLMFETDLQARFLIPMAVTLVFGLMTATVLVPLVVPSLIAIQADIGSILRGGKSRAAGMPNQVS